MNKKNKETLYLREAFSEIDDSVGIVMPILMECDKDEDFSEGIDSLVAKYGAVSGRGHACYRRAGQVHAPDSGSLA